MQVAGEDATRPARLPAAGARNMSAQAKVLRRPTRRLWLYNPRIEFHHDSVSEDRRCIWCHAIQQVLLVRRFRATLPTLPTPVIIMQDDQG